MKRKNRKDLNKIVPTITVTSRGTLINHYTDKLTGEDIGPCMFMNVNQFLQLLREEQEENEVAE